MWQRDLLLQDYYNMFRFCCPLQPFLFLKQTSNFVDFSKVSDGFTDSEINITLPDSIQNALKAACHLDL